MPFQLRSQYNPHELFLLHEEEGESEAEAQAAAEAAARKEQEKLTKEGFPTVLILLLQSKTTPIPHLRLQF